MYRKVVWKDKKRRRNLKKWFKVHIKLLKNMSFDVKISRRCVL